jgi:hypothetical protein
MQARLFRLLLFPFAALVACPSFASLPRPDRVTYMVFFDEGRAELSQGSTKTFQLVLNAANGLYDGSIEISGHTKRTTLHFRKPVQ